MNDLEIPGVDALAATLQGLTENAVASREHKHELAQELFVPAIHSAQQVAEQLAVYDLAGERLSISSKFGVKSNQRKKMLTEKLMQALRSYSVETVNWKTGKIGRKVKHHAFVLVRIDKPRLYPLWDPTNLSRVWDLNDPPKINLGLQQGSSKTYLPSADILAAWVKDAIPLLQSVVEREEQRRRILSDGVENADNTLAVLNI
jgi:hypothetical protein